MIVWLWFPIILRAFVPLRSTERIMYFGQRLFWLNKKGMVRRFHANFDDDTCFYHDHKHVLLWQIKSLFPRSMIFGLRFWEPNVDVFIANVVQYQDFPQWSLIGRSSWCCWVDLFVAVVPHMIHWLRRTTICIVDSSLELLSTVGCWALLHFVVDVNKWVSGWHECDCPYIC